MLFRFCLYGFLKNQQYFEPFLVLVLLEKGLVFFQIGLLIACRELTVNLFEILSGALADVWGRRRSMILSFCAYIASFVVFALAGNLALLFLAMFLFGIGDAFRTGTHKAIIFSWLRAHNRLDERTRVYGLTRSWSKIGSAVSVVLAAIFVLAFNSYLIVFWLAIIPYLANIVNFIGYPSELDSTHENSGRKPHVITHLRESIANAIGRAGLRRLLFESMGFEGVFKAAKDYLQPVLAAAALGAGAWLAVGQSLGQRQQVAVLTGPVYFVIYLASAAASRRAYAFTELAGSEDGAARWLWRLFFICFAGLLPCMLFGLSSGMIVFFVLLFVLQNLWRPILISRFYGRCEESQAATVLSIESQAKTLSTMILAPLMGALVDLVRAHGIGGAYWPVGAIGITLAAIFMFLPAAGSRQAENSAAS